MNKLILGLILGLIVACGPQLTEEKPMNDRIHKPYHRPLGWGLSGSLTPGSTAKVFTIQRSFDEASLFTIQFGIDQPNITNVLANEVIKARADVTWRINGNDITRTVDCSNGISISGSAEMVSARVTDESILTLNNKVDYNVTAIIAPGTRPSVQQPPIYTAPRIRLAAGGGSSVQVPAGAISAFINVAPLVIGPAVNPDYHLVRQTGNGGNNLKSYYPLRDGGSGWVPLANGCTTIAFEQSALAVDDYYYFTTFGIDG